MKFFYFLIGSFVYFNPLNLSSQILNGEIINSTNLEPIKNVLIITYKNNEIVTYKSSDIDGKFKINVKNISKVEFRKLNYKVFILTQFNHQKLKIKLIKKPKTFLLDEVSVKAKKYIRNVKDTVTYKAENLRKEVDVNLEDLIEKIPGIEINTITGEIKYQNKAISRILIDGDDLTGNNYQLISKSLDQKIAKEIQIIDGYSDSKILKKFNRSQQTVINIKSENKYKNKLKGNINLGYGIKERYNEQTTIFLLGKTKILSHISYNNIGNFSLGNISTNSDFNTSLQITESSIFKPISLFSITENFNNIVIGNHIDLTQNSDFSVSQNFLVSKKNAITSKFNIAYYNDFLTRDRNEEIIDLTNNIQNTIFSSNEIEKKKPENILFSNSNKFIINKNLELNIDLSLKVKKANFEKKGVLNLNSFFSSSLTNEKKQETSLRLVKKINYKNALIVYTNFTYEKLEDIFSYNYDSNYFNNIFNIEINSNQFTKNDLTFKNIQSESQLQYIYKPNAKNIISANLSVANISISKKSNSFIFNENEQEIFNQLINNNTFKMQNIASTINWAHFSNSLKLSSSFKLNNLNYNAKKKKIIPTFSFSLEKSIGFNKIQLSYIKTLDFSRYYYFFNDVIQQSAINYFQSDTSINNYKTTNYFSIRHYFNNIKTNFTTGIEINYSISNLPYLNNISYNNTTTFNNLIRSDTKNNSININLSFEKFLTKINHSVKILPKFSKSNYDNQIANLTYHNINKNYKLEITLRSAFDFKLNYYLGFEFNKNDYITENNVERNNSNFNKFSGFLSLNANFFNKKLIINNKNIWAKQDKFSPNIFISNINAKYKFKNIEIKSSVNNIFNTVAIFNRYQNKLTLTENKSFIIDRNLVFQINYIF